MHCLMIYGTALWARALWWGNELWHCLRVWLLELLGLSFWSTLTFFFSSPKEIYIAILLTKITTVKNEVALSYRRVCGLYFLAEIFTATILISKYSAKREGKALEVYDLQVADTIIPITFRYDHVNDLQR